VSRAAPATLLITLPCRTWFFGLLGFTAIVVAHRAWLATSVTVARRAMRGDEQSTTRGPNSFDSIARDDDGHVENAHLITRDARQDERSDAPRRSTSFFDLDGLRARLRANQRTEFLRGRGGTRTRVTGVRVEG
jgi:hypothetical protein